MPSTSVIMRVIACTNFMVTSSALCFQVAVLYPWHEELKEDFNALRAEHKRVLKLAEDSPLEMKAKSLTERLPLIGRFASVQPAPATTSA